MTAMLSIKDLHFQFGSREVLTGVSFEIEKNQLVAVLGNNGAGKSTLLKCINRILTPTDGTVSLNNNDVTDLSILDISKVMSYVPQSIRSSFSMNVFDVVLLGRRPHLTWKVGEKDIEKVSSTLEFLGLQDFAFRRFDQLSGGERQRVIIAKALAQQPNLFLFDEPTSDLDLKNQLQIMKKIRLILSSDQYQHCSALVAIHDINIAARFADKILLLHDGKAFAYGTPSDVLTKENIAHVFDVQSEVQSSTYDRPLRIVVTDEIEGDESE